jgi:hypothetical protein
MLELGKVYVTRKGDEVTITEYCKDNATDDQPWFGSNMLYYDNAGYTYPGSENDEDIVSESDDQPVYNKYVIEDIQRRLGALETAMKPVTEFHKLLADLNLIDFFGVFKK